MSPELDRAYRDALDRASRDLLAQRRDQAWNALEEAHILSQAYAGAHTYVHFRMAVFALRTGMPGELAAQLFRLVLAAPGSWTGKAPAGNTGGGDVNAFRPMPIAKELAAVLRTDARSARFLDRAHGVAEIG